MAAEYLVICGHVGSNTTVDYNLAYVGIPHTRVTLFVDNMFAQEVPIGWRIGYTPQFRKVGVTAAYTF